MNNDSLQLLYYSAILENKLLSQKVDLLSDSHRYTDSVLIWCFGLFVAIVLGVQIWNILSSAKNQTTLIQKLILEKTEKLKYEIRSEVLNQISKTLSDGLEFTNRRCALLEIENENIKHDLIRYSIRTHILNRTLGDFPQYLKLIKHEFSISNISALETTLQSLINEYDQIRLDDTYDRDLTELLDSFKLNIRLKKLVDQLEFKINNR